MTASNDTDECYRCSALKSTRPLTILMLACWQREYEKRPYVKLRINRILFNERLRRPFELADFQAIKLFLNTNVQITTFELAYLELQEEIPEFTLKCFVKEILKRIEVTLIRVNLPDLFFKFLINLGSEENVEDDDSFEYSPEIEVFRLAELNWNWDKINCIRCFLMKNNKLKYFALNNLTVRKFAVIADGIHKSESLEAIDINRIILNDTELSNAKLVDSSKISVLISQLIWQNKLTEIHFRQCELNSFDMEPISEYIATTNLRIVDFSGNHIGPDGCKFLFKAFEKSKTLYGVDLSYNPIGLIGGYTIAQLLPNTQITELNIAHCEISGESLELFLCTLRKPTALKKLSFYGNQFTPKASKLVKQQLLAKILRSENLDLDVVFEHEKREYRVVPFIKKEMFITEYP